MAARPIFCYGGEARCVNYASVVWVGNFEPVFSMNRLLGNNVNDKQAGDGEHTDSTERLLSFSVFWVNQSSTYGTSWTSFG